MSLYCFVKGYEGFSCAVPWLVMTMIFFISAMLRKQLADFFDMDFNLIGAVVLGELAFFIPILIIKTIKIPFLLGIVGLLVGGFLSGRFLGGGDFG